MADMMCKMGFVNVEMRIFYIQLGLWPKNKVLKMVGSYWRTIHIDGLSAIVLGPYTPGLHWTKEQVEVWLVAVNVTHHPLCFIHSRMPRFVKAAGNDESEIYKVRGL